LEGKDIQRVSRVQDMVRDMVVLLRDSADMDLQDLAPAMGLEDMVRKGMPLASEGTQGQVSAQPAAVSDLDLAVMDSQELAQLAADMNPQTLAAGLPGTESNKRKRP
jgi:hypothetical protein